MMLFCSLAELPSCRMQIATNEAILQQLVTALTTPSYSSIAALVAMAGMLCIAYRYCTCMDFLGFFFL